MIGPAGGPQMANTAKNVAAGNAPKAKFVNDNIQAKKMNPSIGLSHVSAYHRTTDQSVGAMVARSKPVDGGMGTESSVQAGKGAYNAKSTSMGTPALGGFGRGIKTNLRKNNG